MVLLEGPRRGVFLKSEVPLYQHGRRVCIGGGGVRERGGARERGRERECVCVCVRERKDRKREGVCVYTEAAWLGPSRLLDHTSKL